MLSLNFTKRLELRGDDMDYEEIVNGMKKYLEGNCEIYGKYVKGDYLEGRYHVYRESLDLLNRLIEEVRKIYEAEA